MAGIEFGLGRFNDLRLEKGGPIFMRRWWRSRARVSVVSPANGRARLNSRASCAITT